MGNAIINIMLSVLIGRFQQADFNMCTSAKFSCLTEHLFAVNRKFTLCLGIP